MAGTAGGGCCVTATTASLVAQGTATGVVLAALVWVGVSVAGLLLLVVLMGILLNLCSLVFCGTCAGGPADCSCGSSSGGGGGNDCGGDCCAEPQGNDGEGAGDVAEEAGDCTCLPLAGGVVGHWVQQVATPLRRLAHHPDVPEYRADVYQVAGMRLCVGCFTTYPVFLLVAAALFLTQPVLPWSVAMLAGGVMASAQTISALGWARTRSAKASIKTLLGAGLALFVYGVLSAPLGPVPRFALLASALAAAYASTVPRRRRMHMAHAQRLGD